VLLTKWYKQQIAREEEERLEVALKKVAAERRARRAQAASEVADAEAKALREQEKGLATLPHQTLDEQVQVESQKLNLLADKESAVQKEVHYSKEVLAADAERDAEIEAQLASMKREEDYIKGLQDVEKEQQMRLRDRNHIPGELAINGFGKLITSKHDCEVLENNTVWRNGKCIVGGEEDGPDTPEEIRATEAARDAEEELHQAIAKVQAKERRRDRALDAEQTAKGILEDLKQKLEEDPADGHAPEIKASEAKLADAEKELQAAQAELDAAKSREATSKQAWGSKLSDLLQLQKAEEELDQKDVNTTESLSKQAEVRADQDEDKMAGVEDTESKIVGRHVNDLERDAARHEDVDDRGRLQAEAGSYRLWQRDAEDEAKALRERDAREIVRLHDLQREDVLHAREKHRKALADAAASGGGSELLKPTSLPEKEEQALKDDNVKLESLMEDEAHAKEEAHDALDGQAEAQRHKNAVALRRAETEAALRRQAHSGLRPAALCLSALGPASGRHRLWARRPQPASARRAGAPHAVAAPRRPALGAFL